VSDKHADGRLEELEIDLLLEAVLRYYGYDFRDYEASAVRRRIRECMLAGRISTISRFQEKVLHQPALLERFLQAFSSTDLAMFSDPYFYFAFTNRVVPHLKTYPFARIWHVGCSTGEEVYSLAILLQEENIYHRTRIYATDLSGDSVRQARLGSFKAASIDEFESNYRQAGGRRSLSGYFRKKGDRLLIERSLTKNIVFSEHNLATDSSFNEFQVIVCRGVLGNFNHKLRQRVDRLIYDSLSRFGVLALDANESLKDLPFEDHYSLLDSRAGLYQKHGPSAAAAFPGIKTKELQRG
jgi:chemotaxis protein methyltransferase CheR